MLILAIDIGGTTAKMGLLREDGTVLARQEVSVCFDRYETPVLNTVIAAAAGFLVKQEASVSGVAVSATGQIDTALGIVAGTSVAVLRNNNQFSNMAMANARNEKTLNCNLLVCVIFAVCIGIPDKETCTLSPLYSLTTFVKELTVFTMSFVSRALTSMEIKI